MRIAFSGLVFLFILSSVLLFGRNGMIDIINKKAILKEYIHRQEMLLTSIENYETQINEIRNNTNVTEDLIKAHLYLTTSNETLYINRPLNQKQYGIYLNILQTAGTSNNTQTTKPLANTSGMPTLGDSQ